MPKTIIAVSDTHDNRVALPEGDILIHAGDATVWGDTGELIRLNAWFGEQSHPDKLFVAGNHDFVCQRDRLFAKGLLSSVRYVEDEMVVVQGLSMFFSPWILAFGRGAFMKGEYGLAEVWERIPEGLDVLVTHMPPHGILDQHKPGAHVGSTSLATRLAAMAQPPRIHIFGHVHQGHGKLVTPATTYYNVAVCDHLNKPAQPATTIVID